MRMYTRAGRMLFLALMILPLTGAAQEITWTYSGQPTGWIGISFDYTIVLQGGEDQTMVVISEVAKGSPAEAAGILVGDTLTHLDGQPISQKVFSRLSTTLEPGDLVRMTIRRNGRTREVLVEAGVRPETGFVLGADPQEMVLRLDTLRGAILSQMDSLRLSITRIRNDSTGVVSLHVLSPSTSDLHENLTHVYRFGEFTWDTLHAAPFTFEILPDMGVPFPALLVKAPATDSLRTELSKLRRSITEVRRQEVARKAELEARVGSRQALQEALERDQEIQALLEKEQRLLEEHEVMAERLRRVSEEEMKKQWVEVQTQQEQAFARALRRQDSIRAPQDSIRSREVRIQSRSDAERARAEALLLEERERFRSPHIVGQSFILGAELKALNPGLAEYFGVESGVLVMEVVEGTQAAAAGIQSGDVIIRMAGEDITSLSDFRFVVAAAEGPLRLRVIRKGEPVELLIRR